MWIKESEIEKLKQDYCEKRISQTDYLNSLAKIIDKLREEKNYELSDSIRKMYLKQGFIFENTKKGTIWKYKRWLDNGR